MICTKDRPEDIQISCRAAHMATRDIRIIVVDASVTDATQEICERMTREYPDLTLTYRRAHQSGLTRQRNEAIGICRELDAQFVHFIDDDTEVATGYFDAIERRFRAEPDVIGVGGVIVNQPRVTYLTLKRFFLLGSRRRGVVLRSGRNMMGQYPGSKATDRVDWLSGCSMSYRMAAFDEVAFDSRLEGYALGEDLDFSFRLSREHRLAVEPSAVCVHRLAATGRISMCAHARQRTLTTYRWVSEHRRLGLSLAAFWWSVLGEILLRAIHGALCRDTESLDEWRGVLSAVLAIVRQSGEGG